MDRIGSLLAEKGYEVSTAGSQRSANPRGYQRRPVQAVLEGDILYLSLTCTVVPSACHHGGGDAQDAGVRQRHLHFVFPALRYAATAKSP